MHGCGVDVGHHGRLRAAPQHQYFAPMFALRHLGPMRCLPRRHLVLQNGRQQRPQRLTHPHRRSEQRRSQTFLEQPAHRPLPRRALHPLIDDFSSDIEQMPILDTARTGGLAVQTRQAAIQVLLSAARHGRALEHLFDQINAPARAIEFIAQQLIGRTGRIAKSAVHTFADNGSRLIALWAVLEIRTQVGLHGL